VTPTRPGPLLALVVGAGLLAYALAALAYAEVSGLPGYAPVTLVLLAVTEAGMARVVRDRLTHRRDRLGRAPGRPLHPLQVARAAVLAKASSTAGAVLLGGYAGLLAWTLPRREALAVAERDALVAGASGVAALGLVLAALLLERACRTPPDPDAGPPSVARAA
jgi:hypothetical protein